MPEISGGAAGRISLPKPLTSFIGREHELAQAKRLLAGSYLVTLTGPGGSGKTRPDGHVAARGRPGNLQAVTGYLRDLFSYAGTLPAAGEGCSSEAVPWSAAPPQGHRIQAGPRATG